MSRYLLCSALLVATTTACQSPIGVVETGFQPVYQEFRANVLDAGQPSSLSRQVLAYLDLDERYRKEPAAVITELEAINRYERSRNIQVALAELNYDLALEDQDRTRFLGAAVHAYLYLFGDGFHQPPNPYSPRFRLACDLYNRGLARALLEEEGNVRLAGGVITTPSGPVTVECTRPGFPWGEDVFSTFLPADVFEVRGLRERVRTWGLGVPLLAIQGPGQALREEHVGKGMQLPATAFLRLDGQLEDLASGTMKAILELHLGTDVPYLDIDQQRVPLETDLTAPLAHMLEESSIWEFKLRGFLKGTTEDFETGVFMLQPYQEGKIPLVLIHGTASSPATWAQLINGILADRRIRSRYQIWLALYNTGNPIAYSAALVRDALVDLQQDLVEESQDPALSNMVLVGHSQGGLLTRLLVSESGDRLWNSIFDEPFETYELEPETRELLEKTLFFEPLPFAKRTVFISTPHAGSYVADSWMGRFASRMVELPSKLQDTFASIFEDEIIPEELGEIPTSVDNMNPDNRFIKVLATFPFAEDLNMHSIIAVKPIFTDFKEGNDGVVEYSSAHLEEAESEFVVRHSHSCQSEPATVGEIRRILHEHAQAWQP